MGEGIPSIYFDNSPVAKSLCILGGCRGGESKANTISKDLDSKITVKSGKFIVVGVLAVFMVIYSRIRRKKDK